MLAETRNLLAENNMYQRYEFTSLRQLVIVVREVNYSKAISAYLLGFSAILSRGPVAENQPFCLLLDKYNKIL